MQVFFLTKKACREGPQAVAFTIPIFEPLPPQYYVRCVSDGWLGAETTLTMSFHNLILPQRHPPHTVRNAPPPPPGSSDSTDTRLPGVMLDIRGEREREREHLVGSAHTEVERPLPSRLDSTMGCGAC